MELVGGGRSFACGHPGRWHEEGLQAPAIQKPPQDASCRPKTYGEAFPAAFPFQAWCVYGRRWRPGKPPQGATCRPKADGEATPAAFLFEAARPR